MKKTKLLTSLAAFVLVLGLGACTEVEQEGTEGGTGEESETPVETKTVLGAADPDTGVYYYFNGETTSSTDTNLFLAVTTSWDEAVDVTIEALADGGDALSFVDGEGATKYIAWDGENGNSSIQLYDEAYAWYWVESSSLYAAGSEEGRLLALYAKNPSFRTYAQTDEYLAYGHVAAYTEEPESATPAEPEPATAIKLEEVTSLTSGESYYFGSWTSETSYNLATGVLNSTGYRLATTTEATEAALFTATSSGDNSWKLTLADGTYVYAYAKDGYADIGLSSEATIPESGVNTFSWSTNIHTLCTTSVVGSDKNSNNYKFSYFEFYSDYICLYGQNSADSATNAAHFYSVVAAE